jgi:hypothetical protein
MPSGCCPDNRQCEANVADYSALIDAGRLRRMAADEVIDFAARTGR